MYINIDTVTIRSFDKTRWNDEIKEREEIPIEDREYEIVAIDKNVHGIWEFALKLYAPNKYFPNSLSP